MKYLKPITPGTRGASRVEYSSLLSGHKPTKSLVRGGKRSSARNGYGRITVRHKGGGHARRFRDVDFVFNKKDIPARIASIEYDPHRNSFIGLAIYKDGEKRYIPLPQKVKVGDSFTVGENVPVQTGNRLPLGRMPLGTFVYNVELKPGRGGALARSAGNFAEVVAHDAGYTHLKLPSTEVRRCLSACFASVGEVSNPEHRLIVLGKAGRSRWMGVRPTVRGSAMNPVDHPHGGGEGRAGRGHRRSRSAWGKPTGKGQKTRHPKKYSNVFIVSRRRVGKRT